LGNGIAAIDETLIAGLDPARFAVKAFVLRADLPPGRFEVLDWCRVFLDTKIGESRLKRSP
jgi:hypothetical protein